MNEKLKIAIIGIRGFPANYGGFEVTSENVAVRLVERGHSVTAYCRGFKGSKPDKYNGIKLRYLPSIELVNLSTPSHTTFAALDCALRKFNAIFAFNVGNALQVKFLRMFGKKSVLFVDGLDWKRQKYGIIGRTFLKRCESLAASAAKHIVVDAIPAQEHYYKKYEKKVHYIPSGSQVIEYVRSTGVLEKYGLQPKKYVTSIGRFTQEKRQDLIVKAFRETKTDMKLVMVGGNKYNPEFEERVKLAAGDDPRVILTGSIYGTAVDELYFKSAIFINASLIEGTSLSLLQAMGSGSAILVSDIPENIAAVHEAALAFRHDDYDDFVQKFQQLLDSNEMRDKLAEKGKKVIEKYYSWDVSTTKFEKLLLDAAGVKTNV